MIARLLRKQPRMTSEERMYCAEAFLDYALLIEFRNEFGELSDEKADRLSEKLSEWGRRLL
ncbi:hypothetical protein O0555_15510 [Brevibacillus laterosporus]|uniref:hypothetical protein n=1 Tax=Brevibacillus laterosporus TaxID=1465 RepID=UPI00215CADA2|nr:hypothetical protein [Brevibacillus laterosporus]MCR8938740.1 hypothetical protein [Brevibacillus laterosporus]MCZ0841380.1 hypothetical protein [Brevibacillus laterosporus]MCZ0847821.1 hypothetical protein [Brevibacillus laterosporus]